MNVRKALERFVVVGGPVVGMVYANDLAPIIEKALDATIDAFVETYNFTGPMPKSARKAWHDVFVAAMVEES